MKRESINFVSLFLVFPSVKFCLHYIESKYFAMTLLIISLLVFGGYWMYKKGYFSKNGYGSNEGYGYRPDQDESYVEKTAVKQQSVDEILDKISKKGMNSLTKKEKEILKTKSEG